MDMYEKYDEIQANFILHQSRDRGLKNFIFLFFVLFTPAISGYAVCHLLQLNNLTSAFFALAIQVSVVGTMILIDIASYINLSKAHYSANSLKLEELEKRDVNT